jgi:hypothetical protein
MERNSRGFDKMMKSVRFFLLKSRAGEAGEDDVEDDCDVVADHAGQRALPQRIGEVFANHVVAKQHHASCNVSDETRTKII